MMLLGALTLLLLSAPARPAPHYHVLLVAVPHPECDCFPVLGAARGDVEALAEVLEKSWNVPKTDVTVVFDPKSTTKQAIKDLIRSKLIDPCTGPDDVVYFGFVGHGFQVVDLSKPTK